MSSDFFNESRSRIVNRDYDLAFHEIENYLLNVVYDNENIDRLREIQRVFLETEKNKGLTSAVKELKLNEIHDELLQLIDTIEIGFKSKKSIKKKSNQKEDIINEFRGEADYTQGKFTVEAKGKSLVVIMTILLFAVIVYLLVRNWPEKKEQTNTENVVESCDKDLLNLVSQKLDSTMVFLDTEIPKLEAEFKKTIGVRKTEIQTTKNHLITVQRTLESVLSIRLAKVKEDFPFAGCDLELNAIQDELKSLIK